MTNRAVVDTLPPLSISPIALGLRAGLLNFPFERTATVSKKTVDLLLLENVEALGIVGDVVSVKIGYARNYLLPRNLATAPSQQLIEQLAEKRAEAERERAALRERREQDVEKLQGFEITLERACNDQGQLYGSVTQQDIADILNEQGFEIRDRDVRLPHTIKRIDSYDIPIKPEQDLEATIKVWVVSDRELPTDEEAETVEVDEEGNLIENPKEEAGAAVPEGQKATAEFSENPEKAREAAES